MRNLQLDFRYGDRREVRLDHLATQISLALDQDPVFDTLILEKGTKTASWGLYYKTPYDRNLTFKVKMSLTIEPKQKFFLLEQIIFSENIPGLKTKSNLICAGILNVQKFWGFQFIFGKIC